MTVRCDGPEACDPDCLYWLREISQEEPQLELIEGAEQYGTFGSYRQIFEASNSTFLCQLDADDWLEPDAIAQAVAGLEDNSKAPFLYTQYQEVNGEGKPLRKGTRSLTPFHQQRMLVQFITYHLRVIRRSAYHQCGGYNSNLQFCGDYDLSLRLCELGIPTHLAKPLYNYRLHGDNTSSHQRQATIQEAFVVAQQALSRRHQNHRLELLLDAEACRVTLQPRKGPVVIAGMHRSGTSLLALMLQRMGLELGNDLLPADGQNPDGYGEDQPVVSLQRQALRRFCHGQSGWSDWGWQEHKSATDALATPADVAWRAEACHYLTQRRETQALWGWKDPRSTLFLEAWLELEPGLKLIAVYRDPWEIVDALQRLTPPVF
ncbi:MAG: glycosyltransferase, partial [Betaproteobacteria bacterium]|nr:glycosyltransferase [Betaproteobacteria bacterium]